MQRKLVTGVPGAFGPPLEHPFFQLLKENVGAVFIRAVQVRRPMLARILEQSEKGQRMVLVSCHLLQPRVHAPDDRGGIEANDVGPGHYTIFDDDGKPKAYQLQAHGFRQRSAEHRLRGAEFPQLYRFETCDVPLVDLVKDSF